MIIPPSIYIIRILATTPCVRLSSKEMPRPTNERRVILVTDKLTRRILEIARRRVNVWRLRGGPLYCLHHHSRSIKFKEKVVKVWTLWFDTLCRLFNCYLIVFCNFAYALHYLCINVATFLASFIGYFILMRFQSVIILFCLCKVWIWIYHCCCYLFLFSSKKKEGKKLSAIFTDQRLLPMHVYPVGPLLTIELL